MESVYVTQLEKLPTGDFTWTRALTVPVPNGAALLTTKAPVKTCEPSRGTVILAVSGLRSYIVPPGKKQ